MNLQVFRQNAEFILDMNKSDNTIKENEISLFAKANDGRTPEEQLRFNMLKALGYDENDRINKSTLEASMYTNKRVWEEFATQLSYAIGQRLPNAMRGVPFFDKFVDYQHMPWGEKYDMVVEDKSILVTTKYAGQHWDTNRQRVRGRQSYPVATDWYYIHGYVEMMDFLLGRADFNTIQNAIEKGIVKFMQDTVVEALGTLNDILPKELNKAGAVVEKEFMKLVLLVQGLNSNVKPIIAGNLEALNELGLGIDNAWVSPNMADESNTNGHLYTWKGYDVFLIPTMVNQEELTIANNQGRLLVLPSDNKLVTTVAEGTPLVKNVDDITMNQDATMEQIVQFKLGTGVAIGENFGVWNLA